MKTRLLVLIFSFVSLATVAISQSSDIGRGIARGLAANVLTQHAVNSPNRTPFGTVNLCEIKLRGFPQNFGRTIARGRPLRATISNRSSAYGYSSPLNGSNLLREDSEVLRTGRAGGPPDRREAERQWELVYSASSKMFYAPNQVQLAPEMKERALKVLGQEYELVLYQKRPKARVLIIVDAFTDGQGSEEYNLRISNQRAQAVGQMAKGYLDSYGIDNEYCLNAVGENWNYKSVPANEARHAQIRVYVYR